MAADSITQNMKYDADDIERWAREIKAKTTDSEVERLAEKIRRTARDIFD